MEHKIAKVCSACGSENVLADAYAVWDIDSQGWEISDAYEKNGYCKSCDGESRIIDRDLAQQDQPALKENTRADR